MARWLLRQLLWSGIAVAAAGSSCGCASLTLATLGTLAGFTSSAVSTGGGIYRLGKLDAVEMTTYDDAVSAVRHAAADLRLIDCSPRAPVAQVCGAADFAFEDDLEAGVKVHVERRTEHLVRIRIDVGLFGSELTARLFLTQFRAHLPSTSSPRPTTDEAMEQGQWSGGAAE